MSSCSPSGPSLGQCLVDHNVPYNFHVASMGKAEFLSSKPVKYDHQTSICHQNLVGGLNPSEKYEFVSWDYEIPNIWKVIKIMFQTTNQKSSLKNPSSGSHHKLRPRKRIVPVSNPRSLVESQLETSTDRGICKDVPMSW